MKPTLGLVAIVFVVLALGLAGTAAAAGSAPNCDEVDYSGDGSSANPYEVTDADELQCLGDGDTNSGLDDHFELQNDIDLSDAGVEDWNSGEGFEPIAASDKGSATDGTSEGFVGSFDGNGYTISGLEIDRDDDDNVGLFGLVGDDGEVSDVTLENVDVRGAENVGGLVGMSTGIITDARATGEVWATGAGDSDYGTEVGGLVGRLDGDSTESGTISHSSATVNVTAESGERAGGLMGSVSRGPDETSVSQSFAMGDVTGVEDVGGLAGMNNGETTSSYATGSVSGEDNVGGLVGRNAHHDDGYITDSYATGDVDGEIEVGGLVGRNDATVEASYALGAVDGEGAIGGVVGSNDGDVSSAYASGPVGVVSEDCEREPGEWVEFGYDAQNLGVNPCTQALPSDDDNVELSELYETDHWVHSSPAVSNGTVYVGSGDTNLYAIDAETGEKEWAFETGDWVDSSPVVKDEIVFVGSEDETLYAIHAANGTEKWSFEADAEIIISSPTVVDDTVYVADSDHTTVDGTIYAVDRKTGTEQWNSTAPDGLIYSSPAVDDSTVYVGSNDSNVYAFDADDGSEQWTFETDNDVQSSPTVVDDIVIVGSNDDKVYGIDADDGSERWRYDAKEQVRGSPAVWNGTAVVGNDGWQVHGIDIETGEQDWLWDDPYLKAGHFFASPTIADGTVYVTDELDGDFGGNVYAIDAESGNAQWYIDVSEDFIRPSPAVADGRLYFGSEDDSLYVVEPTVAPPGGVVGDQTGSTDDVTDSYWDHMTSTSLLEQDGTGEGDAAVAGLTTAEMSGSDPTTEMDDLDFSGTWGTVEEPSAEATADGYPILSALENEPQLHAQGIAIAGGEGTEENPYEIENWYHLDTVRENLEADFVLIDDLDQDTPGYDSVAGPSANGGEGFDPIGERSDGFAGEFDGDGHTISGLTINREATGTDGTGLFDHLERDSTVSDLGIEDVDITSDGRVGGLAGNAESATVSNVYTAGEITADEKAGGLIGIANHGRNSDSTTITESHSTATVTVSDGIAGGLVGTGFSQVEISASYATGDVTGGDRVGGLFGDFEQGEHQLSTSYATGEVTGDDEVGGLVGHQQGIGEIEESYAIGTVSGDDDVGGLIGKEENSVVDSYWDTEASGTETSAGGEGLTTDEMSGETADSEMDGFDFDDTWAVESNPDSYPYLVDNPQSPAPYLNPIEDWYDLDDVRENLDADFVLVDDLNEGTAGYDEVASETANDEQGFEPIGEDGEEFTGTFDGSGHQIGGLTIQRPEERHVGLFGYAKTDKIRIENVRLESVDVHGEAVVGGLAGRIRDGTVENVSVSGTVVAEEQAVGGLVGQPVDADLTNQLAATGTVEGKSTPDESYRVGIGGLVGRSSGNSDISVAYTNSTVIGENAGGIMGSTSNNPSTFRDMYSASVVDDRGTETAVGAVAGIVESSGDEFKDSVYWDTELESEPVGAEDASEWTGEFVGLETDEMKGDSAEENMDELDWEGTWQVVPGDYPVFQWEAEAAEGDEVENIDASDVAIGPNAEGEITVVAADSVGNEIEGEEISIDDAGGLGDLSVDDVGETNESGEVAFEFEESEEDEYIVKFSAEDDSINDTATVTVQRYANDEQPYEIENWYHLDNVRENLDADFVLVDNLDENTEGYDEVAAPDANDGDGFEPIGDGDSTWEVEGDGFNGTFDGNDRTITNLTIDRGGDDLVGLFEAIGSEGTVSNLTFESATVEGNDWTGGLSGQNYGTVSNLTLESATVMGNDWTGGLIGKNRGTVSDVSMSTDVTASGTTGGVIGRNYEGTITGATTEGAVFSEQDGVNTHVGGIVGDHERGSSIDSSSFTNGTVDGDNEKIGGIAGRLTSPPGYTSSITNSSANGTIGNEDADSIGGLIGVGSGEIFDSYSTATVRGNDTVGGVIGYAGNSDIERTYAVGEVDGEGDDVGGLVGIGSTGHGSGFTIENSYWDTETTRVNESFDTDDDDNPTTTSEGGLTTDEMTGANAVEHMKGFEFPDGDDRWHAVEDDYPVLSYEDSDSVYGVEITGTNSAIDEGKTLEVNATVTNFGSDGDEQLIELRDFGGDDVDTEEVTLTSGESTDLTLEWETEVGEDGLDDVMVASENHTDTRTVSVGAGEVIPQCQTIDTAGAYELTDDIEASGDCVEIEADDVSLDGNDHTISGSGTGIVVDEQSNVTITNVTLSGLDVGIEMTDIEEATVTYTTVEGSESSAIDLEGVADVTVKNNTVEGSDEDGLVFKGVQDSTIANNTVTEGATSGLHLVDATDTAVENNTLRGNDGNGMYILDSEELVVSGNEVVDNGEDDEDELSPYVEDAGIYFSGTADSTLEANNLTANAQAALFLEESSTDNTILGNDVNVSASGENTNWRGIKIDDSPGNTVSDSVITGSELAVADVPDDYFIYVDSAETVVKDNEIDGHAYAGIDVRGESNTVDNNTIAGSFIPTDDLSGHAIRVSGTGEDWSVTNNSLTNAEILTPERSGIAIIGDQTVEIQNNTGTKLDSDLSSDPGTDLELTFVEQFVENQQLTTPVGDTTVTFTGAELRLDGVESSVDPGSPDDMESTGYYFEVDSTSDGFTFENLELAYNETDLQTDETVIPETFLLWRFDGNDWKEIDDSGVDTDEQIVTGNVTEAGTIGVFGEQAFADGNGSADDPFVIENWVHLENVRLTSDSNFTLANDLDSETDGYDDVAATSANDGAGFDPIDDFEGTFDGDGATISDLQIDRSDESDVGLFAVAGEEATIEDVHLENATVSGESTVGGLVGSLEGTVSASSTDATVSGEESVGGLIGENAGDVTTTYAVGDVSGETAVGGLVGEQTGGEATINQSYAVGNVTGNTDVGGLVGASEHDATVDDAYWDVETTGQDNSNGGTDLTTAKMTGATALESLDGFDSDSWTENAVSEEDDTLVFPYPTLADNEPTFAPNRTLESLEAMGETVDAGETGTVDVTAIDDGGPWGSLPIEVTDDDGLTISVTENETDADGVTSFEFDGETVGEYAVSIAPEAGDAVEETATVAVETGDADSVEIETEPDETQTAGESLAGLPAVTVTDEFANPVDDIEVTAEAIDGDGEITQESTTTVETDSEGVATFDDLVIETADEYRLEFSIDGDDENVDSSDTVESDQFTVDPADPTDVSVTPDEAMTTVSDDFGDGNELEYTGTVEDEFENPVPEIDVELTDDGDEISVDGERTQQTGTDGDVTFTVQSTVAQEDVTFTFTETDEENEETAEGTFEVGEPAEISAVVTDDEAVADGSDEVEFTVTIEDKFDNPLGDVTVEVDDTEDVSELGELEAEDTAVTDASGEATFTANSTNDGEFTVQFSESDAGSEKATATFVVGEPATVSAEATVDTATADGSDELEFEVTVTDANDNAIEGVEVRTDHDGTDVELEPTSPETGGDGTMMFTATSTDAQGDVEFTFEEQGEKNSDTSDGTFEAGDPDSLVVEDTTETAGEEGEIIITLEDEFDNPVPGETVGVADTGGIDVLEGETVETNETGEATLSFTEETADRYDVTLEVIDDTDVTDEATVTVEPAAPDGLVVEGTTETAGEEATLTLTLEDEFDNPVPDETLEVTDADGIGALEDASTETDGYGEATLTFTEERADDYTVEIGVEGDISVSESATVTVEPADADSIEIETQPAQTQTAGVTLTGSPAVLVTDEFDNPVAGVDVTVEVTEGEGDFTQESTTAVGTEENGEATFDDLVIETADEYRLEFAIDGDDEIVDSSNETKTDQFDVAPVDPADVSVTPDEAATTVSETFSDGNELEYTVTVEDGFENPVPEVNVELTDDGDEISVDGDRTRETDADGTVIFTVQSTMVQEDVEFAFEEAENENSDASEGSFEAGGPDSLVVEDTTVTAGNDGEAVITLEDEFENPVPGETVGVADTGGIDALASKTVETNENGEATLSFTEESAESYDITLEVVDDTEVTDEATVTVEPAAPDALVVEGTTETAGEEGTLTLSLEDAFGNPVPDETLEVTDAGSIDDLEDASTETDGDGEATLMFTEERADEYDLAVAVQEDTDVSDETTVTVESAAADSVEIETQPAQTQTAGDTLTGPPSVTVTDEFDNPVEGVEVTIEAIDGGDDRLEGSTTAVDTDSDGLAASDDLVIKTAGEDYRLEFSIDAGEENDDSSDTAETNRFDVEPADPADVSVTPDEATTTVSETFNDGNELEYTGTVEDEFENPVPEVDVKLTDDGDEISVDGDRTEQTDADGTVTFTVQSTVAQEDVGFTFTEQGEENDETAGVTFETGTPANIDATVTEDGATADGADEVKFTVTIEDEYDNPVEDATVEVDDAKDVAELDGLDAEDTAETDADGEATFTANSTNDGEFTVQFSESDTGSEKATATFVVGEPATVSAEATVDTATADGSDELEFEVTVTDANDNAIEGVEVRTDHDGTDVELEPTSPQTDGDGTVTFAATSTDAQEDVEFTFEEQEENNDAVATGAFEAGELNSLEITDAPDSMTAGDELELSVSATDVFDNPAAGQTLENVDVRSEHDDEVATEGSLELDEGGEAVLTVEANEVTTADDEHELTVDADGVDSDDTTVTIDSAEATTLSVLEHPDATQIAGETIEPGPVVNTTDGFGNPAEGTTVSVKAIDGDGAITAGKTTTATGESGNATFSDLVIETADENYRLEFGIDASEENDDSTDLKKTDPFDVEPAEVESVVLDPDEGQTITAGEVIAFNATASDEFGNTNESTDAAFTWANAREGGVFGNTTAGTHEVSAELAGVENSTTVTVEPAAVETVGLEPSEDQQITAGVSVEFNATAYDEFDNTNESTDAAFTWSNATEEGIFENTTAGTHEVTAELAGVENSTTVTVDPAPAHQIVAFDLDTDEIAFGAGEAAMNATIEDEYGNRIVDESDVLSLSLEGATDSAAASVENVGTDDDGNATVTVAGDGDLSPTVGNLTVTANLTNKADDATADLTVVPDELEATFASEESQTGENVEFEIELHDDLGASLEDGDVDSIDVDIELTDAPEGYDGEAELADKEFAAGPATITIDDVTEAETTPAFSSTLAGGYELEATAQPDATADVTDTGSLSIEAADANEVTVETQPEDAVAGEPIAGPPTANVTDEFGNPVPEENVTVEVNSSATLAGETDRETNESGLVQFDDLHISDAGSYELTFKLEADSSVAVTTDSFDVNPADPDTLEADDVAETAGFENELTATLTDAFDNPIPEESLTVTDTDGLKIDEQNQTGDTGNATFAFTEHDTGEYNVTLAVDTDETVNTSATVTIERAAVKDLELALDDFEITTAGTTHLTATATYANGTTREVTEAASLTSNATDVATIEDDGVISGVGDGVANLSAAYYEGANSTTLDVIDEDVDASASANTYTPSIRSDGETRDIRFRANASEYPGDDPTVTWRWEEDGADQTATGEVHETTFSTPETVTVELEVDARGETDTDTMNLSVNDPLSPDARLDAPQSVDVDESFSVDASDSTDNVEIAEYAWDFGNGTTASGADLDTPTGSYSKPGVYDVELTVVDTSGNEDTNTTNVMVKGANATIPDTTLEFGDVGNGLMATTTIPVENDGTTPLEFTDHELSGDNASAFDITGVTDLVDPGETHRLDVAFTPTKVGEKAAELELETNSTGEDTVTIDLTGVGVESDLTPDESTVDFGEVDVGTQEEREVTIENEGGESATITDVTVGEEAFEVVGAPDEIDVGESEPVTVAFEPETDGSEYTTLRVEAENDSTSISLTGTGLGPEIRLGTDDLEFETTGINTTTTETVEIRNTGSYDLDIEQATVAGSDTEAFRVVSEPDVVGAGKSKTLELQFEPEEPVEHTGTLAIEHNDTTAGAQAVDLSGDAVAANIGIDSTSIDFGVTEAGTSYYETVTVSNDGGTDANLTVDDLRIVGSHPHVFDADSPETPLTIEPGDEQDIVLNLTTDVEEPRRAQLQIRSDAANQPQTNVWLSNERGYIIVQEVSNPTVNIDGIDLKEGSEHLINVSTSSTQASDVTIDELTMTMEKSDFEMDLSNAEDPFDNELGTDSDTTLLQYIELDHISGDPDETFDETGVHYRVDVDAVPDGATGDDVSLHRYNDSDGEWAELAAQFLEERGGHYYYKVETPGFSEFAVTAPDPTGTGPSPSPGQSPGPSPTPDPDPESNITVIDAALEETQIIEGETATVTVTLENDGGPDGEYTLDLSADGTAVATETVSVGAGQTTNTTLSFAPDAVGKYDLEISGRGLETLVVEAESLDDEPAGDDDLLGDDPAEDELTTADNSVTIWMLLIGVASGLLLLLVVLRQRRREKDEANDQPPVE